MPRIAAYFPEATIGLRPALFDDGDNRLRKPPIIRLRRACGDANPLNARHRPTDFDSKRYTPRGGSPAAPAAESELSVKLNRLRREAGTSARAGRILR